VIVAVPFPAVVAKPLALTVVTLMFDEDHVIC
jgi:hypothetical protein